MTRINRPDTLLTELRDIKRRLRLLEADRMRPPATVLATGTGGPSPEPSSLSVASAGTVPVPLAPVRPTDWPATSATAWERLSMTRVAIGPRGVRVELSATADEDTAGAVRVVADGTPMGVPVPVAGGPSHQTVEVPARLDVPEGYEYEIAVEALRTQGDGMVRTVALLLT
ncbi:MAG TPA: hypothetical protein VFB84_03275 [Micromonosporaceae bacterium]|nr:hypothetical protein [Micromonosporaceae bacterium]